MHAQELQAFFNLNETTEMKNDTATILSIDGRQHPVYIHYLKSKFITLQREI